MDRIEVHVRVYADRRYLQLQWEDPVTGSRKTVSARTEDREIAERKRGDLEYELNHGGLRRPARLSWAGFREAFEQEHLPTVKATSRKAFGAALDAFERIGRPSGLASLDARTVSRFHAGLLSEEYAPGSIDLWLRLLKTALRWARRQKLLPEVPAFPSVKVPVKPPRPLHPEHYEHVMQFAGELAPLLALGWHAGLRVGEACALSWEEQDRSPWVDLQANRIRFPVGASKGGREDWVPIAPDLRAVLERVRTHGAHGRSCAPTGRVVPLTRQDGRPVSDRSRTDRARLLVRRLARRAGVRMTFHSLRKAFCTRYASKVPAQVLMRLARHSSIKVTLTYYADVDEAMMAAVLGNSLDNSGQPEGGKAQENRGAR